MNVENILHYVYKSRNNIINYLNELGYDCKSYKNFSMEEVNLMIRHNKLDFVVENPTTQQKTKVCYVFKDGTLKKTINKDTIETYTSSTFEEEDHNFNKKDNLILIVYDYSSENIHNYLKDIWDLQEYYVVIFKIKTLLFNILDHVLVPKHIKLNEEEKTQLFFEKNIIDNQQLPEISRFDPVSKILLLRPGQVCKIIRNDKISYENEYYRICI